MGGLHCEEATLATEGYTAGKLHCGWGYPVGRIQCGEATLWGRYTVGGLHCVQPSVRMYAMKSTF